ncbi:MAG: Rieske 2Fe-2S domain-containing protein [Thermoflavifilum sp.]|nr:Rieske 2Fe-2S domain-containing protein [Thermoflavifilum sp.]MCL6513501.1 Rieske 2Fe-2S domain-containing protein [Alicyclobacillus sp.]
MRLFKVDDINLLVYHLSDGWYATGEICTHQACSLWDDGELEEPEIVCTCHGGAFDIRSGAPTRMPCVIPLETYDTRVVEGQVEIDLP